MASSSSDSFLKLVPWNLRPSHRFPPFPHTAMRFSIAVTSALLTWTALAVPVPDDNADALATLNELAQLANQTMLDSLSNSTTSKRSNTCTARNISVRKEWYKWLFFFSRGRCGVCPVKCMLIILSLQGHPHCRGEDRIHKCCSLLPE